MVAIVVASTPVYQMLVKLIALLSVVALHAMMAMNVYLAAHALLARVRNAQILMVAVKLHVSVQLLVITTIASIHRITHVDLSPNANQ